MINPKELRLGNYVCKGGHGFNPCTKDDTIEVYDILQFGINKIFEDAEHSYKDIYPIPLTEEILLQFGFVKSINKTYVSNAVIIDSMGNFLNIMYNLHNETVCIVDLYRSIQLGFYKYVHQLQNLYFALTGQELILKQTVAS